MMSEAWAETTLGEVCNLQVGPAFKSAVFREATRGPRLLRGVNVGPNGTRWDETFLWPEDQLEGFERFFLEPGDVCIAMDATFTSKGQIRAAKITEEDLPALLVQRVARLRCEEQGPVLDAYVGLLVESSAFRDHLSDRQTGAFAPHISGADITGFRLLLPPLPVQRRIVDLMAHLDLHLATLRSERDAAIVVLESLAFTRLSLPGDSGRSIADLLNRNIGGIWGESPGASELTVDVFRSTEFTDLGRLSGAADAVRSITGRQYESRYLASGDILLEKSGGTPTRPVGRVVRVSVDDFSGPAVGANFLQLLRADEQVVSPDYLFWVLWASHRRGDAFDYQQASTNIRNLKTKEYLARRVDLPDRQEQEVLSRALDNVLACVRLLEAELTSLGMLRTTLLSQLISGQIDVPSAYELLLDSVA